jgi:hypothetical protein
MPKNFTDIAPGADSAGFQGVGAGAGLGFHLKIWDLLGGSVADLAFLQ